MPLLLTLLPFLAVQEKKADLEKTRLFVYDSKEGITLRVKDDGKVELAVREEKGEKSYAAGSVEEFEKKHAELVKKHGLRRYFHPEGGLPQAEFERWWKELNRKRPPLPELPDFGHSLDEDLEKFLEDQKKRYEEFRKEMLKRFGDPAPQPPPVPAPAPSGKEFGVKIESVGETLRDQLSLKEGEGLLVGEVKPGSIAEKAGLRQHDIVLKLDGRAAGDKWEFRKDVLKALEKPEFEVEILRGGKKETLKAKPGAK